MIKMLKVDLVNKVLLCILVGVFVACVVLMLVTPKEKEAFTNSEDDVLMSKLNTYLPDISNEERDQVYTDIKNSLDAINQTETEKICDSNDYVPKTNIPPSGPRIDMSQYVLKSSIPAEKVCPPQKEVDLSEYVKKSTLPPAQKCAPCVAPKVKVDAKLCKRPAPCPPCPKPEPCPQVTCPEPEPCPVKECPKCDEIKYIKVPTIITRTIKVDNNNNVISESVENGNVSRKVATTSNNEEPNMTIPQEVRSANKNKQAKCSTVGLNSDFKQYGIYGL